MSRSKASATGVCTSQGSDSVATGTARSASTDSRIAATLLSTPPVCIATPCATSTVTTPSKPGVGVIVAV